MRGTTQEDIDNWFTYHPPTAEQQARYVQLRETFKRLAEDIVALTPSCADQTAALRQLRECSMAVTRRSLATSGRPPRRKRAGCIADAE